MRKYLSVLFFILIALSSCMSNTENNDKEKPVISDIYYNFTLVKQDTLMYGINDSILLNRNRDALIDTLIIGKPIYLSAHFHDNDQLSSYYLSLDSLEYMPADSIFADKAFTFKKGFSNIFAKKDTILVKQYFASIPDSISVGAGYLHTREGNYLLRIRCVDIAGNSTDSLGYTKEVKLFKRQTLLEKLGH